MVRNTCGAMMDVAAGEECLAAAQLAQLHGGMCSKLALLVAKLAEPLPALHAKRHRWQKSGVQAFSALHLALYKAQALLHYCGDSSKLYLAIKGLSILRKFECIKKELAESIGRLSIMVPQDLALQMAGLETELSKTEFILDPVEKEVGAEIVSLLLQKQKGGHFQNPQAEQESFSQIATKLGLTTAEAIHRERKVLIGQLEKVQGKQDKKKEATIMHILHLLKKFSTSLQTKNGDKPAFFSHYSFSRLSWSGSQGDCDSENSRHRCIEFNCSSVDSEGDNASPSTSAKLPLAPEEFRCPISLQLMSDPVIVASGQTYERFCIEKWFREGHVTCPKTQQRLEHLNLTSNYCVKALIAGWCDAHGMSVPEAPSAPSSPVVSPRWAGSSSFELMKGILDDHLKQNSFSVDEYTLTNGTAIEVPNLEKSSEAGAEDVYNRSCSNSSISLDSKEEEIVEVGEECVADGLAQLVANLKSRFWEVQCQAAEQIRLYTKSTAEARLLIGEAGAIPGLVDLLYTSMDLEDMRAQEICAFALLNMAVNNDRNKAQVVSAGAVPVLVKMLKTGAIQSVKEAAAAVLLTLSCLNDNKACIGSFGAIPHLVKLLISGSNQGRKDALTTLYNLTIFMGNRHRVIRAGAVPILIHLLSLRKVDLIEKCGALLYNLSFTDEGRASISQTDGAIATLVEILEMGSDKEKEHVVATLLLLCSNSTQLNQAVLKEGAIPSLVALSVGGTPRSRDKAQKLLQHFRDQREKPSMHSEKDAFVREELESERPALDKEELCSAQSPKPSWIDRLTCKSRIWAVSRC